MMHTKKRAEPPETPAVEGEEDGYYRLFPADKAADDSWVPVDPKDVLEVRLFRLEGSDESHLDNYAPEDLPDEKAVKTLHGPGKYLAIAIDNRPKQKGRILKRRTFKLAGEPGKPPVQAPGATPPVPTPSAEMPVWAQVCMALGGPFIAYLQASQSAARQEQNMHLMMLVEAMRGGHTGLVDVVKAYANAGGGVPAQGVQPSGVSLQDMKDMASFMKDLGVNKQPKEPDVIDEAFKAALPMLLMKFGGGGGLPPGLPGAGGAVPALAN